MVPLLLEVMTQREWLLASVPHRGDSHSRDSSRRHPRTLGLAWRGERSRLCLCWPVEAAHAQSRPPSKRAPRRGFCFLQACRARPQFPCLVHLHTSRQHPLGETAGTEQGVPGGARGVQRCRVWTRRPESRPAVLATPWPNAVGGSPGKERGRGAGSCTPLPTPELRGTWASGGLQRGGTWRSRDGVWGWRQEAWPPADHMLWSCRISAVVVWKGIGGQQPLGASSVASQDL